MSYFLFCQKMSGMLQYISLKVIFLKCSTFQFHSDLYSEGFYRGFCTYSTPFIAWCIQHFKKQGENWFFLMPVNCISWFMEDWNETFIISSAKTFDSNMSTKGNKNFEPVFRQCSGFCSGNVCKSVHIQFENASFAYLNKIFQKPIYYNKYANKYK